MFAVDDTSTIHSVPLSAMRRSYPRLLHLQGERSIRFIGVFRSRAPLHLIHWDRSLIAAHTPTAEQSSIQTKMPHPIRAKANGRPYFCIWIKLWGDDVSGNRSKQWNKHWNWYFAIAGLPKRLLHQEYFVHFLSTSPYASVLEQAKAICDQVS